MILNNIFCRILHQYTHGSLHFGTKISAFTWTKFPLRELQLNGKWSKMTWQFGAATPEAECCPA